MPGTPTPNYAWPIPADNDSADGPDGFHDLGYAADATVKTIDTRVGANETAITALNGRYLVVTSATRPAQATPGVMLFETDTGRLLIGVAVSGVNYWVPMPGALVLLARQTTAQSLADGTYTPINLQAVDYNGFNSWTAPTKFQPKFPGWFEMNGTVTFQSNAVNQRSVVWTKNGVKTQNASMAILASVTGSGTGAAARSLPMYLNGTTDYVEMEGVQYSGAALSTSVSSPVYHSHMSAKYLGPHLGP